jgi:phosphoglycerate dehydrogenase-like enzyme
MSVILIHLPPDDLSHERLERIQALAPGYRVVVSEDRAEIEPLLDAIEIAAVHFPPQWIERAPRLRWYQQWGAGTDWLLRHPEIARRDFILTNASGVHAIPISEHILAMLLAFTRQLPAAFRAQAQRRWQRDVPAGELAGCTLVLVGVGAIGRRTARIASALGMRVIGVRRNPARELPEVDRMVGTDQILDVLPEADFVVLTIPLTADTRHLLDARAFEKMKPSAYVINIGRGGTIDEEALVQALRSGAIAGAGLDVFASEPLPADSPLWEMENVIITAHYSGSTPHYDERALKIFIDNLERFVAGLPLRNVVDKQAGY